MQLNQAICQILRCVYEQHEVKFGVMIVLVPI